MSGSGRRDALVRRPAEPPSLERLAAERRVGALVREVVDLDDEVEALARALAGFEARYREATAAAFAELDRAERLRRRVELLAAELARLAELLRRGPERRARAARAARARSRPVAPDDAAPAGPAAAGEPHAAEPDPEVAEVLDAGALDLKALYRALARRLHPDLAGGDGAEEARRSALMARANAAYARRDRAELELLAERAGLGEDAAEVSEEERRRHLADRAEVLERARARLAEERARLAGSDAARLREEDEAGADPIGAACQAALGRADGVRDAALAALEEAQRRAAALGRDRRARADGARRRGREPVRESPLVKPPLRRVRAGAEGRAVARWLEARAAEAPGEAALTLLAFALAEAGRPPEAVALASGLRERWEALRAGWPGTPDLGAALAAAPRHLELGLRDVDGDLVVGLQPASAGAAAGIREALPRPAVAAVARRVLWALGPRARCPGCDADVYAVHLVRARGVDEVHGLACPDCAAVLRSYWRYGAPEGLEALEGFARRAGLVVEQRARLGGVAFAFQMLPAERARLTARALVRRLAEVCLAPCGVDLPPRALRVRAGGRVLPAGARVPEVARVELVAAPGGPAREAELLARMRDGLRTRFRG